MPKKLEIWLKLSLPFLGLGLSVLLVFVPEFLRARLTLGDQLLLATTGFLLVTLFELLVLSVKTQAQQARGYEQWILRSEADQKLANIRAAYSRIVESSYGHQDLFLEYFSREIEELARRTGDAAEKQELRVRDHHFQSADNVMSAFLGEEQPVLRYVWILSPGEPLFDDYAWKRYFQLTVDMVRQRRIEEVRAVLVVREIESLNDPRIQKLLAFYRTSKRVDCRVITQQDFDSVRHDSRIPGHHIDFGIYGSGLMFLTESYNPTVGAFTKDRGVIAKYTRFFDTVWSSGITKGNPSTASDLVTVEELMRFDAEEGQV